MTNQQSDLTRRVIRLLESLDDAQRDRIGGALDDPSRQQWTYLPGDRPGLSLVGLDPAQRALVDDLLTATHSELGAQLTHGVIANERLRRELATGSTDLDGDRYWLRVWDAPTDEATRAPWAWQINGHHLAVSATVVGDSVTITPHFLGAEPATAPSGPRAGQRLLGQEEDLARALLALLDADQRELAVTADVAPDDILTRADPVANPDLLPTGIVRDDLDGQQRAALDELIRRYLDRAPRDYARKCWDEVATAEPGSVGFAWAGPVDTYGGHYYCLRTPTFLVEYDNTQDDANHAHSVWRHLHDDWGADPLRQHYAAGHV